MMVTAFVRHDLFPYYLVFGGELLENMNVKTEVGHYAKGKVIRLAPFEELGQHRLTYESLMRQYKERERLLRIEIINENIDFIDSSKL